MRGRRQVDVGAVVRQGIDVPDRVGIVVDVRAIDNGVDVVV